MRWQVRRGKSSREIRHGGVLVDQRRDAWGVVEVVDHDRSRCLHFGSSIRQSGLRLDRPECPLFEYDDKLMAAAALHAEPRDVLILGLGAGSVARRLHGCLSAVTITAVERREVVIDLALEYFGLPADERLQLFTAEAEQFLEAIDAQWDLLLVDLFNAVGPDPALSRLRVFDLCRSRLRSGGVLVVNLWRNVTDDFENAREHLRACFGPDVWYLDEEDGNTVAYAFKGAPAVLDRSAGERLAALSLDPLLLRRLRLAARQTPR